MPRQPNARRSGEVCRSSHGDSSVRAVGVGCSFGAQRAVQGVDLQIRAGEVHALVGENGAGKSTLGKILSGSLRPTAGRIEVGGEAVEFRGPADALHHGIATMHQEVSLALDLSVLDNVMLGREHHRLGVVDRAANLQRFTELCELTGFELDPHARARSLPLASQQEVEVLRALVRDAQLIVMDEPTAALPGAAAAKLHAVVRSLRGWGTSVVYISHFLEEVIELSDRISVLRNGRLVATVDADTAEVDLLVRHMLGRDLDSNFPTIPAVAEDAPVVLEARGVRPEPGGAAIDLTVRQGEILGIFGLVGSGRSELAMTLFGANPRGISEVVTVAGVDARARSPREAMRAGLALLPESRKEQGLFLGLSQSHNAILTALESVSSFGLIQPTRELQVAHEMLQQMGVEPVEPRRPVGALSGGNQQKVLFAKTLIQHPRVLILDEPTRGIDVGSRRAIYNRIADALSAGMALVMISSEIEEVLHLAHRVLVLREGAVVAEFEAGADHDALLGAAFGLDPVGADRASEHSSARGEI